MRNLFTLALWFVLPIAGHPLDWPQFRGPTAQGVAEVTSLPIHWSQTSNVLWRTEIPGNGWSSPVKVGNQVFLTTAAGGEGEAKTLSLRVLAIDSVNGKILWNREVFTPEAPAHIHQKNSHASPTPLVENGRIYAHFGHNGTAALTLDGTLLWRNSEIRYPPVHGSGGSPVVAAEKLIFSCDGASNPFIIALNKNTGKVEWKTARSTDFHKLFSFSTPLVYEVDGKRQVASPASGAVYGYDPETGNEIWKVEYDGYSVVPRPVFGKGLLFLSSGYDRPFVLAIRPDGKGNVTGTHIAWQTFRGAPNTPSMLLGGDELYFVSDAGIASCVDALTGKLHWQERIGGDCSASPILAAGKIYIQNESGTGVVLQAGKEFKLLAKNELDERTLASYAVDEGALFIRTEKHLYKIGE